LLDIRMATEPPLPHPIVQLADEVTRINGRLKTVFAEADAGTGLSKMELTVLISVFESRHPPTVPRIGRSLGHPRQVIQRATNALVAGDLLETLPNPDHKRAPLLRATDKGIEVATAVNVRARAAADALLQNIDATQCRRAADELNVLRKAIEEYLRP
jgi:DNA-binding MarR family transcriptional regulator